MASRVAGLVLANLRPSLEQRESGARSDRHRVIPARFRLSGLLSKCGFVASAGQANVRDANRYPCTLRVDDVVAGDGGRNARLLRARRSRSDLVAGRGLEALRRAYR